MGSRHESHALFVCNGIGVRVLQSVFPLFFAKGNKNNDRKVTRDVVFNGFKELKKVWFCCKEQCIKALLREFFV
jgi:UMF1 family MFS transporter